MVMPASEMTYTINKEKFDSYCQSTGYAVCLVRNLCAQCLEKGEPDIVATHFCGECALPFRPGCLMIWHLFIEQGFAAEEWMMSCFQKFGRNLIYIILGLRKLFLKLSVCQYSSSTFCVRSTRTCTWICGYFCLCSFFPLFF